MRIANLSRIALVAVAGVAFAFLTYAQQDPSQQPAVDPLAEAARKARAKEKTEPKPKKVYTNDDFASSSKPAPAADSSAPAPKKDGDTDQPDADQKAEAKSEEYWRKQFASERQKLSNAEKELDILQRELDKSELQYYPDPQKALAQQYNRSDINDKRAKIDAKQKEVAALKQHLSDMEDDLRKAGGDPGWAR